MRNRKVFSTVETVGIGRTAGSCPRGFRPSVLLNLLLVVGCLPVMPAMPVWAKEKAEYKVVHKVEYKDIYLTENRVCKACRLEWVDQAKVRLVNRAGEASIVPVGQVMGIDRHPVVRKAMLHALRGVGLPGEVLVPSAFDDGNDFVCKYCSTFNR